MNAAARYVVDLCRAFVDGAAPPPLDGVDGTAVSALLRAHRLSPTVGPLLLEVLPADSAEAAALRRALADYKRRSGLVGLELERVGAALDDAAVAHVTLKGLALGRTVYPGPERRFVSDMDVLVGPAGFERALAALEAIGFHLSETARETSFYRRHHFHLILLGPLSVPLELHWDLSRPQDYFRFDVDGFIARSQTIECRGSRLRVPSDADQLLHSACQALRDGYADLRRIVDAALLVRNGAAAHADLPELARAQGMSAPLWLLLETQAQLLGVCGGEDCARRARPGLAVRACLRSLELPRRAVIQEALRWIGLKRWLVWVCAPSAGQAWRQIGRFVRPGEAELLDAGHVVVGVAGPVRYKWNALHMVSLCKLAMYQLWCLIRAPTGRT